MTPTLADPLVLDIDATYKTTYCIPLWLRDEQIRQAIARVPGRIAPQPPESRTDPIALVCYGPSLNETWAQVCGFRYRMTCSGAHRFLIDRGIVPTWHIDVDPRPHKATLIGRPHPDVEYLMASTCHADVFDLLEGFKVTLWHIYDTTEDGLRLLPPGEWALTGGSGAGLRMMTLAHFLGFRDLHIFGMDGSEGVTGKHAAAHPSQAQKHSTVDYKGVTYRTTPAFLTCAKQTFHELDQMPAVHATFYGEGLVQAMAKDYVPARTPAADIAFTKPVLISAAYAALNAQLHRDNLAYGVGGGKHADTVLGMVAGLKAPASVLDYGCGKGYLAKALPMAIWEYDPAIAGKDLSPRPADLVVCTDVLEHVERETLAFVLGDLRRCVKQLGYFVIHTGPAKKTLPDGRNTHLIQKPRAWWETKLAKSFTIGKVFEKGPELHIIVAPLGTPVTPGLVVSPRLHLVGVEWRRSPYAIGVVREPLGPTTYDALAATFPSLHLFANVRTDSGNNKYSLSEVNNRQQYHAFMQGCAPWRAFYEYVKSPAFLTETFARLQQDDVFVRVPGLKYKARFEFSLLPADGGCLRPHTDIPSKVVTIVLTMRPTAEEWGSWGGATLVLEPRDGKHGLDDYKADLGEFDVVHAYPYVPNQAVVFIKTANSWHAVGPMVGPCGPMRRTVTINIERQP